MTYKYGNNTCVCLGLPKLIPWECESKAFQEPILWLNIFAPSCEMGQPQSQNRHNLDADERSSEMTTSLK